MNDSYITNKNQPHELVLGGCGSSDALQVYSDGHAHCYSCDTSIRNYSAYLGEGESEETTEEIAFTAVGDSEFSKIESYLFKGNRERGITKPIHAHFGCRTSDQGSVFYPYHNKDNEVIAYKERKPGKVFTVHGDFNDITLFGQQAFERGGKRVVVTEGEYDALSYAQASLTDAGNIYPVVSMPSATGLKAVKNNRDWLRSFDEVVLWLDADDAGKKALKEVAKIIGYDKVKVVYGTCKDANALLLKEGTRAVTKAIWNAEPYSPAGIIASPEVLWKQMEEYTKIVSVPYPDCLTGLNEKVKGMRFGEITLWTSGTGSGKSTLLREIIMHLTETTDDKIGLVSLEESPAETSRKLAGMAIKRNPAKEEIPLEDLRPGFDKVFGSNQVIVLDHQGAISDGSIIDTLEAMCIMGAKYLFVDHITILASEGMDGLTGNEAVDRIMNQLLSLAKRHQVWIGLVSHLRKMTTVGSSFEDGKLASLDDIRGSGSIKQVSFDILAFARNLSAEDEGERNTIKMAVLKSRYTGLTGPCGTAKYNYDTGRLVYGGFDVIENTTDFYKHEL